MERESEKLESINKLTEPKSSSTSKELIPSRTETQASTMEKEHLSHHHPLLFKKTEKGAVIPCLGLSVWQKLCVGCWSPINGPAFDFEALEFYLHKQSSKWHHICCCSPPCINRPQMRAIGRQIKQLKQLKHIVEILQQVACFWCCKIEA
ncbi:hypothetical protein Ancab_021725 [Ancistrocladus abbreviatus]